ncbi:hypothetical protein GPJ56_009995 [Histomonas meleagridis]|uniref:uncharacterized protein n=1 Tax=Histomonas meleagridis TaxID=135588 RepID=UPI0035595BD9|nr:hypothetical protein GPJ56_009995 [Histomonas meleagridis]KAH0803052.1 hypothetical protein GO595_004145 [Histomonas meleagridis]
MDFKHYCCNCNNIDIHGEKVDLHHKTALSHITLREVLRKQNDFPLLQLNSASISIKDWSKICVSKVASSKFQLICFSCLQKINIYPSKNNCYVQFDSEKATTTDSFDYVIPTEIQEIFNYNSDQKSPPMKPIDHLKTMDVSSFSLEPEVMLDDDNDFEIMFGNQNERFVGSFQDYVVFSPCAVDVWYGGFD